MAGNRKKSVKKALKLPFSALFLRGVTGTRPKRIYKNTLTFFSIFPIFAIGDECDVSVSYMFRHEIINTLWICFWYLKVISSNILEPRGTSFTLITAEMIENHRFWAVFNTPNWKSLKSRLTCVFQLWLKTSLKSELL